MKRGKLLIEPVDHLGNCYKSISEMCKHYGINRSTLYYRIKHGEKLENALTCKVHCTHNYMDADGNLYNTVNELCDACGISKHKYYKMLNAGYNLDEILTKKVRGVTDHTGRQFRCTSEMCRHWGVPFQTYNHRIKTGMSIEMALTKPGRKKNNILIDPIGNVFNDMEELCDAWEIDIDSFTYMYKEHKESDIAVLLSSKRGSVQYICKNKQFENVYKYKNKLMLAHEIVEKLYPEKLNKQGFVK